MLRDDQYDPSSGLPLPSLDADAEEISEADLAYGRELRADYIERQAAKAKIAYSTQLPVTDLSDPANERAVKKVIPEPHKIPEPRRLGAMCIRSARPTLVLP
jgi:hypothetical protein